MKQFMNINKPNKLIELIWKKHKMNDAFIAKVKGKNK